MKKIAIASLITASLALLGCSKSLENQLIGKWNYSTDVNLEGDANAKNSKMHIECNDEFFPNKSVTHDCKFTVNAETKTPDGSMAKFEIAGTAKATGEWSVTKDSVYDKTVDGKFEVESFIVNGQKVDDEKTLAEITQGMSSIFMKGETTVSKSISIDKEKWTFEEEIEKNKVTITATRR